MLKFETEDKDLLVWVKGVTKTPENLTQDDLLMLKENGDPRVTAAVATEAATVIKAVSKEKVTAA